jgi:hypothetical protein
MFISDKAVWNSLKLHFEQFIIRVYWFLTPFLQYLVLEFADTWPWMSLKSPWIWIFLACTNPDSSNLIVYLLQSDSLSTYCSRLLISLSCCHVLGLYSKEWPSPRENIKNDQIGLDLQGDECLVARRRHDVTAVQKMPEWGVSPLHPLTRSPLKPAIRQLPYHSREC